MSRIESLLGQMTLAEKLGQLTMSSADQAVTGPTMASALLEDVSSGAVGSVLNLYGSEQVRAMQRRAVEDSRLHIPLFFGLDIIHGYRTLFPVSLAETASFNRELWEQTAREAALEASREGVDMTFSPMLDVSRDPRWGRTVEGPGEDPIVGRALARAKVRGYQGDDLSSPESLAAVAKHFCAYGPVQAGREYASVDISERTVLEVHMPPFAAAIDSGVAAVMPAFTDLAGIPLTAHREMLQGWLRERLGFRGVIISDYNAVGELIAHGVAADRIEAATLALNAGVDIDMMADAYRYGLPAALERGLVELEQIDAAVRRVLLLKESLGLFEDPYRRCQLPEAAGALQHRRELAREAAVQSLVLLTNPRNALPLAPETRRLAVIGPLADAGAEMRGSWVAAADEHSQISVLTALRESLGDTIHYEAGVTIEGIDRSGIETAVALCDEAEAVVLCLGERGVMSGEAASRAQLNLPGLQQELAIAVLERAESADIPVIVILFSGRPLTLPWLFERADAVLAAGFPGAETGHALVDVLRGLVSPSGRTPISWPRAVGQIPIFYAQRPGGRPFAENNHYTSRYIDLPNDPQFAFGHGLTYGRVEYINLQIAPSSARIEDTIQVTVDVHNTGGSGVRETVFVFIHDPVASVARPRLELVEWRQVELDGGQTLKLTIPIAGDALRFLGMKLQPVFEAGSLEIYVGPSADRAALLAGRIELRQS